jgi:hypothetical protein
MNNKLSVVNNVKEGRISIVKLNNTRKSMFSTNITKKPEKFHNYQSLEKHAIIITSKKKEN